MFPKCDKAAQILDGMSVIPIRSRLIDKYGQTNLQRRPLSDVLVRFFPFLPKAWLRGGSIPMPNQLFLGVVEDLEKYGSPPAYRLQ